MNPHNKCRAFTTRYNGITDRILTEVLVSAAFSYPDSPHGQFQKTIALWDTGATHSAITQATAIALSLQSTGQAPLTHAGGQGICNTYLVHLLLPNQVAMTGVDVTECPDTEDFGVIIGMDIIRDLDFCISNYQGATWFTFRFPSQAGTDYAAELDQKRRATLGKVGRNDSCPCGLASLCLCDSVF
jgi:hypothetical protein